MSSGTTVTKETSELISAVSHAMTVLIQGFSEEQREKLSQWVVSIEDTAEAKIQNLHRQMPNKLKRKNPEVLAAAAIYDTFLEYESRTDVKLGLNLMQNSLGLTGCSINNAWSRLFDNRVFVRGSFLHLKYEEREGKLDDVISNVIQALKKAADSPTEEALKWLHEIRKEALEISSTIPSYSQDRYDVLLVASAVIYAAAKQHVGKMMFQFGQRELSLLASTSPAMISKCWLDIFGT